MHSRLGAAAAAARLLASISHPPESDWPGPLEAGHRRARSLILTPPECKRAARCPPPPAAAPAPAAANAAQGKNSAAAVTVDDDLMVFTPEPNAMSGAAREAAFPEASYSSSGHQDYIHPPFAEEDHAEEKLKLFFSYQTRSQKE